ncbi:MAG: DEAD/DEAH box helicase [Candidatus Thorarchaeota archaeon]|jgi:replicative superfamily II helicase
MTVVADVQEQVHRLLLQIGIRPRGIQKTSIERGLLDGASIMVCSPTGSGKTLVGEMALLRAALTGRKGIYLVPLKALAVQVSGILKERYQSLGLRIGVSTGDFQSDGESLSDHDVIVTTYERADSLLRHKVAWLTSIGSLVIDEIQTLSDKSRGARLETVIIRFKRLISDLQLVGLSATVGAPDELADWLGCTLVESEDRPVPLVYRVISSKKKNRVLHQLIMTTVQGDGQAIIFHRTRRQAESQAIRLSADVGRHFTSSEKEELDKELESVENCNVTVPPELRSLLHDGTAFHHAGLGFRARRLVEELFLRGKVKVICATTTLAAGMDLPARTVILASVRSPGNHRTMLQANSVHQMLGRAGRPGYDKSGFGIILVGSSGEADEVEKRYFVAATEKESASKILFPRYDKVISRLGESETMTEQLLVALDNLGEATLEDVSDGFLGDSFLMFTGVRDSRTPMRALQLGEINAAAAIEKHALSDTVRPARQGVLGSVSLRETNDSVIGGIVAAWEDGHYTCRYSARLSTEGLVEGPQCSCAKPLDSYGVLCPHLVALGLYAARELGSLADYVIPVALNESSPSDLLIRLGLIEGEVEDKLKPTRLGRVVNRLYLSIPTIREMLAVLPMIEESTALLWLLKHLVSIEAGMSLEDSFEHLVAAAATTDIPLEELARSTGFHLGDAYGLLESAQWLLYSIEAVAEVGGLKKPMEVSQKLMEGLERRLARSMNRTMTELYRDVNIK